MTITEVKQNQNRCTNCESDEFIVQEWDVRPINIKTLKALDTISENGVDFVACRKCNEPVDMEEEEIIW